MQQDTIRLAHLAILTGIKRQTLTARAKTMLDKNEIIRTTGNHILFNHEQIHRLIEDRISLKKGKIIYVGNRKGGVGKTTISYLLTHLLSSIGFKVCGLDLDQQSNFTKHFLDTGVKRPVFLDAFDDSSDKKIQDIIVKISPTLDFIPSSVKNSNIQQVLSSQESKHLEKWLNQLCLNYLRDNYDVVIMDVPAMPNTLLSAFHLCLNENDNIIIPCEPTDLASDGITYVRTDITKIRDQYEKHDNYPKISLILNRFRHNMTSHLSELLEIQENHKDILAKKIIYELALINQIRSDRTPINDIKNPKEFYDIMSFLLQETNILRSEA